MIIKQKISRFKWEKQYKEKLKLSDPAWANHIDWKERINEHSKYRYKNDIQYKIKRILRGQLRSVVIEKYESALHLVGCTIEDLISHLESLFKIGMSWKNYGLYGWHIDHIIPCSSFDLTDLEEQKKCFHYTNLQPLWAKDNLSKGAKLNWKKEEENT